MAGLYNGYQLFSVRYELNFFSITEMKPLLLFCNVFLYCFATVCLFFFLIIEPTRCTNFSATVSILALHYGVQKIDHRGTIFTKLSQICAYADDIVIVARTQKLTEEYLDLEEETSKLGMEISESKTKFIGYIHL